MSESSEEYDASGSDDAWRPSGLLNKLDGSEDV